VQIIMADLEVVMSEYPDIIKPLKIAAMARLRAEATEKQQMKVIKKGSK